MTYEYMDLVLGDAVARTRVVFQQGKQARIATDELNILAQTSHIYTKVNKIATDAFKDIAKWYYNSEPHGDGLFEYLWVEELLRTPSPTARYAWDSEIVRKRDRLAEALLATGRNQKEYTTAMRLWVRMLGWFAIEVADEAVRRAREDDGVTRVVWVSEHDDLVCDHCDELDGQVFRLRAVPPKPHPGCRCHLERVSDG